MQHLAAKLSTNCGWPFTRHDPIMGSYYLATMGKQQ